MDFPTALPKSIYDAYIEGQTNKNALTKAEIENKFLGPSMQAKIASQTAYANLLGPQFAAKAMGNPNILANVPEEQKNQILSRILSAGAGAGGGTGAGSGSDQRQGTGNAFSTNNAPTTQSNPFLYNNLLRQQQNLSPQDKQNVATMQPGQAITIQGNQPAPADQPNGKSFAENTADYEGTVAQGKEAGSIRAKAADELDQQYQQSVQAEVPIKHLIEMTQHPVFQNMRNKIPFFQDMQLQALSKLGTPDEQKMVGDFITTTTNSVANTINSFHGRILDKEVTMANNMKISPNDTWDTMLGKLSSIATFNEMTKQRSRIASNLIEDKHLSRGKALEIADKSVDGSKIRSDVDDQLNPSPTDEDIQYMAQKYQTSPEEIKKRLKAKGKL